MKLSEFISETILEIEEGLAIVEEDNSHQYNIADSSKKEKSPGGSIDFDVAITVAKTESGNAKAGLSVVGMDLLGANVSTMSESSAISRIKFSIGKHQITDAVRRKK